MIPVVLAMLWSRRGQAVTLALLAMLAVVSAVAAPAYLLAVERAVAAGQIATADSDELSLLVRAANDAQVQQETGERVDIGAAGYMLKEMSGFSYTYAVEMPVVGIEESDGYSSRLVFRQDVCEHLRILSGRCLAGEGDVLLGETTARQLKASAGDAIRLTAARVEAQTQPPTWFADGEPKTFTVAGIYQPVQPSDVYWGLHGYFVSGPTIGPGEPVFTTSTTFPAMLQTTTLSSVDGIAAPGTLDIDRLDQVAAQLRDLDNVAEAVPGIQVQSGIPRLFARIESGRAEARLLVPVMAVPLVLLACFSIYLTVGHGAEGRRDEIAVVALRGARWWTRGWLATGESLAAVLAGALTGCLVGQLLVNAVAGSLFPGVGAEPGLASLRYAPVATAVALLAVLAAQRRQLLGSVATLLGRSRTGREIPIADVVVGVLAVVAGVQLYLSDGSLDGLGTFAPAFVMLALALLAARGLLPLISWFGVRALRRGRLGAALAGLQLSRRPGAGRLFALLAAAAAVAGYAACAVDTAAQGRVVAAQIGTGADRVLTVQPMTRRKLLDAVRAVDPAGAFAMAVTELPSGGRGSLRGRAVDSTRLAAVASWPDDGPRAAQVAGRLRATTAERPSFTGNEIVVDVGLSDIARDRRLRLAVAVSSKAGLGETVVEIGVLTPGRQRYRQPLSLCEKGCWINGYGLSGLGRATETTGRVEIHGIAEPDRWWVSQNGRLAPAADSLTVDVSARAAPGGTAWIRPASTPLPLPLVLAGGAPPGGVFTSLGGDPVPVTAAASSTVVPGVGRNAFLVDLEQADRLFVDAQASQSPQVWLNAAAPADIVERLAAEDLIVLGDTRTAEVKARLDKQGPALALSFHVLAGILATLLGAGALILTVAVDRRQRAGDLTALRLQGMPSGVAGRATLWTYPVLVGFAAVVGLLVGVAGWLLTGWALPLAGLQPPDLPLPGLPRAPVLLAVAGAVLAVQLAVAVAAGRDLRRRIERPRGRP